MNQRQGSSYWELYGQIFARTMGLLAPVKPETFEGCSEIVSLASTVGRHARHQAYDKFGSPILKRNEPRLLYAEHPSMIERKIEITRSCFTG